ncbi:HAMP domain-containing histidine kinase [Blastococcus sp. TML/M2B]|uniref:sensor histidine kinase n=1 Tax=unclassified Blastococcus TaxID=2619396 RepID=UPI0019099A3F|nr:MULTISPECIES: HAMP domain-containing sensor histidine kinase [unclassified Blastococcus]MBN1094136.1 HAMP domain-containing histidine kinase [Blastococcus sp. TML/M2B]MBN1095744.1 HAMP domain-containing histidine kinase [Blastococcus sp. TML/C7B]
MTEPAPTTARRGPRVPLRVTLVALLVALLAVGLVTTGLASTSLLRGYLTDQSDTQLRSAAERYSHNRQVLRACVQGAQAYPATDVLICLRDEADPVVMWGPVQDPGRMPDLDPVDGDRRGLFTLPSDDRSTTWRAATVEVGAGYQLLVATDLDDDEAAITRLVRIEAVVGLVVLTLLGVAGYLLVRNSLRPLAEVERTAQAIAAGDLSQRVPEGDQRTEVGRLATALNGMLARIESAFRAQQASEAEARGSEEKMRRFVADASHELRTPLTSIRGFAELYRQGAVGSDEEVARLMTRIEAEGGRMGLLVEDLLLLARLDQRRPLTLTPVDLAAIAGDAVHDARAVQPDRPIALHLDETLTDVPVVLGDEGRLRQVVGNLVTNALTHTPPGTRVTVSVGQDGDDVLLLRVADEGPGMADADAARAFERFYRADTSRTRNGGAEAGGTGLGLAIVSSLVQAHGGTIELATAPGRGAAFTVRLRRSGPPQDPGGPPPQHPPAAPLSGTADQPG